VVDTLTQAVLLLTAHFGRSAPGQPKPLGPSEYGRLAQWLRENGLDPHQLLLDDAASVLSGWQDQSIPVDRIRNLLGRSAALGLELEKWERAGLWIMTRASPSYPTRLKRWLKIDAPPFLIGCGPQTLLNAGGVAVVGSRDATTSELALASRLGRCAAEESINVVSGGANGVDETAISAAVDTGGTAVGVLADHLLRAATSKRYRDGILSERLTLVSPFNPEAAFDVGNAMSRNRYIYCLSDAGVVVATANGSGGTWNGAMQDLKHGWVPLWISRDIGMDAGGSVLVEKGARWLPHGDFRVSELLSESHDPGSDQTSALARPMAPESPRPTVERSPDGPEFYELFVRHLRVEATAEPVTAAHLCRALDLEKAQVNAWLERAVADGHIRKLMRPVRYEHISAAASQPKLFS
jgi:predicted Rossmann fold nucleotide-binding protein DprA/Smf involved in DNA uptake